MAMMTRLPPTARAVVLGSFTLAAFAVTSLVAGGQQAPPKSSPSDDEITVVQWPHTAEQHLAAAEAYARKAAEYRKEADLHRRMLAAYGRLARDLRPAPPRKPGKTVPSERPSKLSEEPMAEYRAHCNAYIQATETLARQADMLAEFHKAQAREVHDPKSP